MNLEPNFVHPVPHFLYIECTIPDMSRYRSRGLEAVWRQGSPHQIIVLEGRRAIGKTRLVRHLQAEKRYSSYQTLLDPLTRELALTDTNGWLRSLPRPAIIDEAQLAPELPLALKRFVDGLGPDHHFLLTGSAALGRGSFGGSDPLAGRIARQRLHPFTGFELASPENPAPSLVDRLFDAPLDPHETQPCDRKEVASVLATGGTPTLVLNTPPRPADELASLVHADVLALLGDRLLPDENFDVLRAGRVLDAFLRLPGGLLKVNRLGEELALDRRTVERYLNILERRFLIAQLPNFRAGASSATRSHPKIHATDTALAVESLTRCGRNPALQPELFGQVLESWVWQQVAADSTWSRTRPSIGFWRDASTQAEVDVVLTDSQGRNVGLEVKASSSLGLRDIKGLAAFAARNGLHRGFVIHLGSELHQIKENIWALPLALLRSPDAWPGTSQPHALVPKKAHEAILSTEDDAYLAGLPNRFIAEVGEAYRFLTGEDMPGSPRLLFASARTARAPETDVIAIPLVPPDLLPGFPPHWEDSMSTYLERGGVPLADLRIDDRDFTLSARIAAMLLREAAR